MENELSNIANGTETILLTEDFDSARELVTESLEVLGYKVLAAETGKQAIEIMEEYGDKIDLLVADVIIPDINGKELFNKLATLKPGLKVLFMSGYTNNILADLGEPGESYDFIQKPFSLKALTQKIRDLLDAD